MEKNTKVIIVMFILIVSLLFFMYIISKPKENNENLGTVNVSIGFLEPLGSGDIEVIEFSDFQCPACKSAEPTVKKIIEEYKEDIKFYYRHFPLSMHENSMIAALAGSCANEQGKFWEYHDILFANQDKLDKASLKSYAENLGLNTALFNDCFDSEKYKEEIDKDINEGNEAGVQGTPMFFVNGRKVGGVRDFKVFKNIIEEEISKAG